MNRILLYLHFNKNDELSEYVIYQLKSLRPIFSKVVFITNSKISTEDWSRLNGLYDEMMERENVGFDFGAWRDYIYKIGWKSLAQYDSLTLMNDSCFGPVYPVDKVYEEMESRNTDFWGMTDYEGGHERIRNTNKIMNTHIQSYFQVYSQRVIQSNEFKKFWTNVKNERSLFDVIDKYETGLTYVLEQKGFSWQVYFNTTMYSKRHRIVGLRNYSELMPSIILDEHVPLLKIKSFLHVLPGSLERRVRKTAYPTILIREHLKSIGMTNAVILKLIVRKKVINLFGINKVRKIKRILGVSRKNEL